MQIGNPKSKMPGYVVQYQDIVGPSPRWRTLIFDGRALRATCLDSARELMESARVQYKGKIRLRVCENGKPVIWSDRKQFVSIRRF